MCMNSLGTVLWNAVKLSLELENRRTDLNAKGGREKPFFMQSVEEEMKAE